jgi:cytochrome c oxidase subunit II
VNSTAVVIGVLYGIATLLAVLVALAIASNARRTAHADHRKLARRENIWFVVVVALLLTLLLSTIWLTPYGDEDASTAVAAGGAVAAAAPQRQVVEIGSRQFAWEVNPREVQAGTPLEFRITADDVNHGFGLYDPDDKLVFQVQAVPGKVQKEFDTLTKPGRYRIICLEFCGVGHHVMLGQLTVTE